MIRTIVVASLLFAASAAAQSPEEIAEAALENAPVWDGHNDVPIQLRALRQRDARDTRR